MTRNDSVLKKELFSLMTEGCSSCLRLAYYYNGGQQNGLSLPDSENRVVSALSIDDLIQEVVPVEKRDVCLKTDFYFYGSGWQSWGYGGEVEPNEELKKYIPLIPQWKHYVTFPGKTPSIQGIKNPLSNKILKGQFIIYLRWGSVYLAIASTGSIEQDSPLPPVQFYVDRSTRQIVCTVYSDDKQWSNNEHICTLTVFCAQGFFALQDGIRSLFGTTEEPRFDNLHFLSFKENYIVTGGWESWYNHYANINNHLIEEDLESLSSTNNIVNSFMLKKDKTVVFQVDDGWEQACGQWQVWQERFPKGMRDLATSISQKGYIPGLWVAPFITDFRAKIAQEHQDWLLRDTKGKPLAAGMNMLWGSRFGKMQPSSPYSYFCYDLSKDEVLEYLDSLMETIINEWGFRYIKLDFLFAGMINGSFANGGAAYKWYDRAIKLITKRTRNLNGEYVAYLGCGLPFEPSWNVLPLSRIGPDTKEDWDIDWLRKLHFAARTGAKVNMQSTLGHSFWNQSVFINDPDVIFLRRQNISLTDAEKEMIALINFMFASQIMHSDDPASFSEEEQEATEHIQALYERFDEEEFGHINCSSDTYILFNKKGTYVGLINLSEKPFTCTKQEMLSYLMGATRKDISVEDCKFVPIVNHCINVDDTYTAECHTISIFELEQL